jgi:hypothetical protein
MTLMELLRQLETLDHEGTILATTPWTRSSSAQVVIEPEDGSIASMERDGMSYFLEVAIARELREDLPHLSADEFCDRVVFYAVNDA